MKKFVGMTSVLLIAAALAGCQSHTKTEKSDSSTKVAQQQSKKDAAKQKAKKEKERWEKKVAAREAKAASESRARAESESRAASAKAASESSAAAASSAARAASESKAAAAQDNLGSTLTNNEWFYLAYNAEFTSWRPLEDDEGGEAGLSMYTEDGGAALTYGTGASTSTLASIDDTQVVVTVKVWEDNKQVTLDKPVNKSEIVSKYLHSQDDVNRVKQLTETAVNRAQNSQY